MSFLKDTGKFLQESLSSTKQDNGEEGLFEQSVAATHRRPTVQQRARSKTLINQVLYDVEFNTPFRAVSQNDNSFDGDNSQEKTFL